MPLIKGWEPYLTYLRGNNTSNSMRRRRINGGRQWPSEAALATIAGQDTERGIMR